MKYLPTTIIVFLAIVLAVYLARNAYMQAEATNRAMRAKVQSVERTTPPIPVQVLKG